MDHIYILELALSAILFSTATIFFGATPWRKTVPGRILFTVLFNLSAVLTLICLSYFLGEYPGKDVVRLIIYTITLGTALLVLIAVVIGQVKGRKLKNGEQDD